MKVEKPEDISEDLLALAIEVAARATIGWQGSGEDSVTHMVTEIARGFNAEREAAATFVETMAVARGYAGGMARGPEFVRRTNPSGTAQQTAAAIRRGEHYAFVTFGSTDASLITAAPDLLAALRPLANMLPDSQQPKDALQRKLQEWAQNARAAIAKAEGITPAGRLLLSEKGE